MHLTASTKKSQQKKQGYMQTTPAQPDQTGEVTTQHNLNQIETAKQKTQPNTCYNPCVMDNKHKGNFILA